MMAIAENPYCYSTLFQKCWIFSDINYFRLSLLLQFAYLFPYILDPKWNNCKYIHTSEDI